MGYRVSEEGGVTRSFQGPMDKRPNGVGKCCLSLSGTETVSIPGDLGPTTTSGTAGDSQVTRGGGKRTLSHRKVG